MTESRVDNNGRMINAFYFIRRVISSTRVIFVIFKTRFRFENTFNRSHRERRSDTDHFTDWKSII